MTETPEERQLRPAGATLDWDDPSTLPVGEVKDLFVLLGKAIRAQQLYDANNPVYQRFLSELGKALGRLWEKMDRLQIQVEEDRFLWFGEEVYRSTSRADSLAFLLFKDGIREFTLLEGIEERELPALLRVLNRARDLRSEGDDLLTVLWETGLEHFAYQYVDLLAEGVELPRGGGGGPPGSPGSFQAVLEGELAEEGAGEEGPATVSAEDFNPTLYSLDPREMEQVQEEIRAEMSRDLRTDVLAALFDRIEEPRFAQRQGEILEVFRILLPNFMSRGALRAAGAVLEEITRLLQAEGGLRGEQRALAEKILDEVSGAGTLRELVQALEDGTISPHPSELSAFLRHLRAGALEPLLRASEEAEGRGIQAVIQEAVKGIAERYREALLAGMLSPDPVVAAGACGLAGKMKLAEAAPRIGELLGHSSTRVRLAAVEAAVELRASTAATGLVGALSDREREVRIAAARALGTLRYRPAAPYFRDILQGRAIRQADISEQIAFFESYGLLEGPEGVRLLDGLLNGRGFLGKKEGGEIRACAGLALGKMGFPEAQAALAKAQEDPDPVVRSAVNRALRGEG